jgi:hypothetical protein
MIHQHAFRNGIEHDSPNTSISKQFIGLVNVVQLEGTGKLGQAQLDVLKKDFSQHKDSTPIALFAQIPLWAIYPNWDGAHRTARFPF